MSVGIVVALSHTSLPARPEGHPQTTMRIGEFRLDFNCFAERSFGAGGIALVKQLKALRNKNRRLTHRLGDATRLRPTVGAR